MHAAFANDPAGDGDLITGTARRRREESVLMIGHEISTGFDCREARAMLERGDGRGRYLVPLPREAIETPEIDEINCS